MVTDGGGHRGPSGLIFTQIIVSDTALGANENTLLLNRAPGVVGTERQFSSDFECLEIENYE